MCFPGGSGVKNLPVNSRDSGSIPGSGRSSGVGNGNQYCCLGNLMDRGAWRGVVRKGVVQRGCKESDTTEHEHTHTHTHTHTQQPITWVI